MNLYYKEFIIILYTPEVQKYILIKDLLILIMDRKVVVTGSYYFDSFGGQPDKFLLNQLSKPIIYHIYKIQDIHSQLCGPYCLYFFYLIEGMNFYDAILKMYFESI